MGIRGLTTYVDTLRGDKKVWEPCDLHDTNLVIDGCGLYYYVHDLNHLNIKYGGQYDQLQSKLKEFFSKLKSNKVVPFVVIDGIMAKDEKKFATHIKRKEARIKKMERLWTLEKPTGDVLLIPRLAAMTFTQVLQELQVQYAIADFEADCEIASLANELDAPVMGCDSDFYIFNIKHGYIPFKHYQFSGENRADIAVEKFSFNGFANYLRINLGMLPLLASLVGNDYISNEMLTPFTAHMKTLDGGNKKWRVPTIAKFLSGYKSVSEAFTAVLSLFPEAHRPAFEQALKFSFKEYQAKQSNLIGYFHSGDLSCNIITYNRQSIPKRVIQLYREGLFAAEGLMCLSHRKDFLQTQCEDTSLPSAQECVQALRWYYYTLVLHCEDTGSKAGDIIVTEFDREGSTLVPKNVKITLADLKSKIQIHDIPEMTNEAKKSELLILLESNLPFIKDIPDEHQLVVSALRYWVSHSNVKEIQLAALLVHYVGEKPSSSNQYFNYVTIETVHGFSQWQNVVYWAGRLNSLFSTVFPQLEVAKLYNGVHLCLVYERLRIVGIKSAESMVTDTNLYRQLHDVITKNLSHDCQFNQSRRGQRSEQATEGNRKPEQGKHRKAKSNNDWSKGNRFALLSDEMMNHSDKD